MDSRYSALRAALVCLVIASPGFLLSFSKPGTAAPKTAAKTAQPQTVAPTREDFEKFVQPVIRNSCRPCHNQSVASGEVSFHELTTVESFSERRLLWEKALRMVANGEMPPPGVPKPAGLADFSEYLSREFARMDRFAKQDPGRITARHLNRAEYTNTVRAICWVSSFRRRRSSR